VPDRIPGRFGDAIRALYAPVAAAPTWAYSYFGDFGPATWLYRRAVWKSAVPALYAGPPLKAAPAAGPVYDFVDIPLAANDWAAMMDEFYAAVEDPGAYRPWRLPGAVEGEAYASAFHASVDSLPGGEALALKDNAAFAEFAVAADSARTYAVELRYRADSTATLALTVDPGPPAAQTITVPLPGSKDWATVTVTLPIPAGRHRLRVAALKGPLGLDRFRAR
jgi:hypothetical protein